MTIWPIIWAACFLSEAAILQLKACRIWNRDYYLLILRHIRNRLYRECLQQPLILLQIETALARSRRLRTHLTVENLQRGEYCARDCSKLELSRSSLWLHLRAKPRLLAPSAGLLDQSSGGRTPVFGCTETSKSRSLLYFLISVVLGFIYIVKFT